MNQLIEPPRVRRMPNLMLHCGAHTVDMADVAGVSTPRATSTWTPIPHAQLIQTVQRALGAAGLRIGTQAHSLSHEGQRYFGLMEINGGRANDDYCWVLGLRNSHDKTFPAGIVAGASVFVCDNLSFSGEVKFARKHTRYIVRDLPLLTGRSIGQLMSKWTHQDRRIAAYKEASLDDVTAHDLIIRATDVGVCSNRLIPSVLGEWREPRHQVFQPRNAWSLFNAFTESLKEGSLAELPKRTEALHGLMDSHVGLGLN
ncbi:DUF932 domain-containing protein [Verrucomicrobium sp. BvORR034]|uniref:DUF932 domain-containing protein n=1 Tax=Verrucomicrobium sp. BvORR034 TaxID=1396418 RepID=UPI000B0A204C|nr:DUF932 domain-containing protein [Verrucomicrobium sp. BvORR034]